MRKPFIAGNWKMNTDAASGPALAAAVAAKHGQRGDVDLLVCPPFPYLSAVKQALAGSRIELGGQNCWHEAKGAFTGEVSAAMLKDCGCGWVILGHSERRHVLGETDELLRKKTHVAAAAGLNVIFCVGETLVQRQANQTEAVVQTQLEGGLISPESLVLSPEEKKGSSSSLRTQDSGLRTSDLVIAYEPVWAIGTGVNASPEQAEAVHLYIRGWATKNWGTAAGQALRILYGGSVNPGNAASLMGQPNLDGFLVGGASLKADDFGSLIDLGGGGRTAAVAEFGSLSPPRKRADSS